MSPVLLAGQSTDNVKSLPFPGSSLFHELLHILPRVSVFCLRHIATIGDKADGRRVWSGERSSEQGRDRSVPKSGPYNVPLHCSTSCRSSGKPRMVSLLIFTC